MDIRIARFRVGWIAALLLAATAVVLPRSASADMLSSYTTTRYPTFDVFNLPAATVSNTQFSIAAGTNNSGQDGVDQYSTDSVPSDVDAVTSTDSVTAPDGDPNSTGLFSLIVNLSGPDTLSDDHNDPDLTIAGSVWDPSSTYIWDSGTLLSGNVTAYEITTPPLEKIRYNFIIATTGGELQSAFGEYVEVQVSDLNPQWKIDIYPAFPVPEPSTLAYAAFLVPLGMLMFVRSRRRRRGLEAGPRIAAARLA
jgi:hypothetical protein